MSSITDNIDYDITIIGGGLAGATLALAITQLALGYRVAVVEPFLELSNAQAHCHPSFDGRALALSYGSAKRLQDWGLWSAIKPLVGEIKQIQVSDAGFLGACRINAVTEQVSALGFVIEAQQLGGILAAKLQHSPIDYLCPDALIDLQQELDYVTLELKSGKTLTSRLVIAADGANSLVRKKLGIVQQVDDYHQVAITANVEIADAHQEIAYERFTESGPLALLPMQGNRFGLVWCHSQFDLAKLLALSDTDFIQLLQQKVGYKAGKIIKIGKRDSYPLSRLYAEQNYHHRCLLIANASHTIHPIAGQGLNLGIRDIASVVKQIHFAAINQLDLGEYQLWQTHLAARKSDIDALLVATDSLVKLFSSHQQPQVLARNLALLSLQHMPIAKSRFAQLAMGLNNR